MTEFNKVFLDTAPLIYFLDDDIHFGGKMRDILEYILNSGKKMITSSVTCAEYLVFPYRTANREKADVFFEFTDDCHIDILPITVEIAKKAAAIRAQYPHFKGMDALQLAAAVHEDCDVFLTNDKQLCQFKDIKCITVEDWSL